MSKRRGLTLIEVLVTICIVTVVLAMVGGMLVFMTNSSRTLIEKSEEIMLAQSIENHILGYLAQNPNDPDRDNNYLEADELEMLKDLHFDKDNGNIYYQDKVIFENTGLSDFSIKGLEGSKIVYCQFIFKDSNSRYSFSIGENPHHNSEVE